MDGWITTIEAMNTGMLPTSPRLSPIALELLSASEPGLARLVITERGDAKVRARLAVMDPSKLIAGKVKDPALAQAVSSGLWLWLNELDEAHRIAEKLETPSGALWHAIMHRLEGDFANSKYWLARCEGHPALAAIGNNSSVVLNDLPADNRLLRLTGNGWNGAYFVDLAQQYRSLPDDEFARVLITLQRIEWRVLMEYCASLA